LGDREPIFNAPGVVLLLLAALAAMHAILWVLSEDVADWVVVLLAFIPARYAGFASQLPGGSAAAVTAFVTHTFVHLDVTHLIVNSAWLLAFGSALARRIRTPAFLVLYVLSGIAGALFYLILTSASAKFGIMIGASGAISGLMGAAFRFIFPPRDVVGRLGPPQSAPRLSLREAVRDRRIVLAIGFFVILNLLVAWVMPGVALGRESGAGIAWQAHLGGFFFGFLSFALVDRRS
jgi:membrane associated rhomboid family serine protease